MNLLSTLKGGDWPSVRALRPEINASSANTLGTDRSAHEVRDLTLCPNMSLFRVLGLSLSELTALHVPKGWTGPTGAAPETE